jgi:alpha-galactosidase
LSDESWAITFLNRTDLPKKINYDWKKNPIKDLDFGYEANFSKSIFKIKDLWKNKDVGSTQKVFSANIAPHDVITLKLIP